MTLEEDLAVTVELCGGSSISEAAARLFVSELEAYPEPAVHGALARCRREVVGRLSLAHVLERLDDGRPGAEEAWSLLPKDEGDTAVITAEMREAMGGALALLGNGDRVAARMAFVEAYRGAVSRARAERRPVSWFVSLGHDRGGRSGPLLDAVRAGRITAGAALAIDHSDALVLGLQNGDAPSLEEQQRNMGRLAEVVRKALPGPKKKP